MTDKDTTVNTGLEARNMLKLLQERFPVFAECRPLAIGIDRQVLQHDAALNKKILRIALGMHTNSTRYLKSMEKAEQRFNLDASPAGEVPTEHRAHATQSLRERFRKDAERKKMQREAEAAEKLRTEKLDQLVRKYARN